MELCGCLGHTQSASSTSINNMIKEDRESQNYQVKLLLLGTGDSGKSTFAKQMKIISKGGFSDMELGNYATLLVSRTLFSIRALIRAAKQLKIRLSKSLKEPIEAVMNAPSLTKDLVPYIESIWKSKAIQEVYMQKSEYQLDTNAAYYLDNVSRFLAEDFVPNNQDVLKVRQKTSGILETQFDTDGLQITLVDVGGQRSERRKWLHCFEDVTAIIYFINLGEFDMSLSEDYRVNRLTESLDLFEEISSSDYFSETDFFMFFNKDDMFRRKVNSNQFVEHFTNYTGDTTYEGCLRHITRMFKEKYGGDDNQYHEYVTVSLSMDSIKETLEAVKGILRERLESVL
eukprot:TRINITY_DN2331_c0_g1_i1.p1 TRINITY_DN2331_c0_g1~~TRINITY_DN2331_c0_g1_i1.p1  ORF type:complete len:343 (+),score=51.63 TRINITY_DN2331_c0_g1_i1:118-1146(+)